MSLRIRDRLRRSGDHLLIADPRGTITYASPQALTVLGLAAESVLGATVSSLAGSLGGGGLATLAEDIERGPIVGRAFDHNGPSGALGFVALPADVGVAIFIGPLEDAAVADGEGPSRLMLDKVLGTIRDAVLVTAAEPFGTPGPIIVYGNEALEHHTGYLMEELLGRSPRILQGPGTDRSELDRLRSALEAWQPVSVEVVNYRKDGTPFWVEMDITPLADASGWFTHWISVQRDITARKQATLERESQQALVQSILDSLPAQTAMLDADGRIIAVNRAWRDYWAGGSEEPEPDWSQISYLNACVAAIPADGVEMDTAASEAGQAAEGIKAVIEGRMADFSMDYECPVGDVMFWFHLHVLPLNDRAGAVVTHTDITRRKEFELRLHHQATHDDLTGLPNRTLAHRRLDEALSRGRHDATLTAVIFVSLDSFKDINYAYGHARGDTLLQTIASRLSTLAGPQHTIARFGADEFVFIMTSLPVDWDPHPFLRHVRDVVGAPVPVGSSSIRPSMSFGVVTSPPHEGTCDSILRDADTAMYVSKRAGRDRWTVFTDEMRRSALVRATSEKRIIDALEAEDFVLHFQPIIDLGSGRTVCSEALLRLRGPEGTLLLPGEFLPVVESGPLAEEVGLWVLNRALEVQAGWLAGGADHCMSVNVSPRQFGHGRLPGQVAAALERHGVRADHLIIEITEDVLLDTKGAAGPELHDLNELGVHIAMDDFGTGYSSLDYLQRFPIDVVKVDRAFLNQASDEGSPALLAAIIGLASAVGATSVIEGVETREQLDLVRRVGANRAQGYLFGRPVEPGASPSVSLIDPNRPMTTESTLLSSATPA